METRRSQATKGSELPSDYLKLVCEVFTTNFDSGLKILKKLNKGKPSFHAQGMVFPTEIVLHVSLLQEGQIAATSVYASTDFDPKASSPTVQDLLAACVDAVGTIFGYLLSPDTPERIERVAEESLSAFEGEDIPFNWTEIEVAKRKIHVKVDKANPALDHMADDWLKKHDPDFKARQEAEEKETEALFITGPRGQTKKKGPGTIH